MKRNIIVEQWEKLSVRELYNEYNSVLHGRNLKMRAARIDLCDSTTFWGKWDRETRSIFLSRKLLFEQPWPHVVAVLRHEMAHQWVDEQMKVIQETPHGPAFQEACELLGLPRIFSKASVNLKQETLSWKDLSVDDVSDKMLERVRKLLNLATSSNEHEALLAMNRVRELYAKYNLETAQKNSEFVHIYILSGQKRLSTPVQKVIGILVSHFFVQVIVGRCFDVQSATYHRQIELIGTRENVLMAEYVYYFLINQSQILTEQVKKMTGEKWSSSYRRSYHLGVLQGFDDKLTLSVNDQESVNESVVTQALVAFKKDKRLDKYVKHIYPRLSRLTSQARLRDRSAYDEGKKVGRKLTLKKPLESKVNSAIKFLTGR